MKNGAGFLRFSLATLLLACVFAGAVMGCWIGSSPWVREYDLVPAWAKGANCYLNDYLTFNGTNEKFAVFRSDRKSLELYDLTTRKSVWTVSPTTCGAGVSLNFLDEKEIVNVGSPSTAPRNPFRMDCRGVSDGRHDASAFRHATTNKWPYRDTLERVRLNDGTLQTSARWKQYSDRPIAFETAAHVYRLKDGLPDGKEWAVPSPDIEKPPQPICKIFTHNGWEFEIRTEKPVVAARYSGDGQLLALMDDQGTVSIWKRLRNYDSRGLFSMPIFWIAMGAGVGLCFRLVRFVFAGRKRESTALSPPAVQAAGAQGE